MDSNNSGDDDLLLIGGGIFIIVIIVLLFIFILIKKKPSTSSSSKTSSSSTRTSGSGSVIYGGIPSGTPDITVAQAEAAVNDPAAAQTGIMTFIHGIPELLTSRTTWVQLAADLLVNRSNSMLGQIVKGGMNAPKKGVKIVTGFYDRIKNIPNLTQTFKTKFNTKFESRTVRGAFERKYPSMTMLERAKMGFSWNKKSVALGENTSGKLASEAGSRFNVAGSLIDASSRLAAGTAEIATRGASMLMGVATDPLMVGMAVGMALDYKNVGNYAELTKTSDLLGLRNKQLNYLYSNVIDCSSWPRGPSCPPASGSTPVTPEPSPRVGRFPQFLGPLDLMEPEVTADIVLDLIAQNLGNPAAPSGPFKKTIDLIRALPQTNTVPATLTALTNLFNSINYTPPTGTADYTQTPFIWARKSSQTIIQNAITSLGLVANTQVIVSNLKILFSLQKALSDYIVRLLNTNTDDADSSYNTLISTPITDDTLISTAVDAYMSQLCVQNGGVIFNPGNGWNPNTCTWATKSDCHGAFPWVGPNNKITDPLTSTTARLLCTSSSSGSSTVLPDAQCPALNSSSAVNLTYSEWRDKNWFNKPNIIATNGEAWNAQLNQTELSRIGGACIVASAGLHQYCDEAIGTQATLGNAACGGSRRNSFANNIYIRETGTCVNSSELCRIKGVSFAGAGGSRGQMTPSELGGNAVDGANYDSCYVSGTQHIAEDLFGSTIIRFYKSGGNWQGSVPVLHVPYARTDSQAFDTSINTVSQGIVTKIGQPLACAGAEFATGITNAFAAVATGTALTANALECIVTGGAAGENCSRDTSTFSHTVFGSNNPFGMLGY